MSTPKVTNTTTRVFLIHGMNAAMLRFFSSVTSCAWSSAALKARSNPQKSTRENATVEP